MEKWSGTRRRQREGKVNKMKGEATGQTYVTRGIVKKKFMEGLTWE